MEVLSPCYAASISAVPLLASTGFRRSRSAAVGEKIPDPTHRRVPTLHCEVLRGLSEHVLHLGVEPHRKEPLLVS